MARTSTACSQAEMYLRILSLIPRYRGVTAEEIRQGLEYLGYSVELLTLQRALKTLRENPFFSVQCDTLTKPYVYRMVPSDSLAFCRLSTEESLLLELVEQHLKNRLPSQMSRTLEPLFAKAHEVLSERSNSRARTWTQKVAVVPNALRFEPPELKEGILDTVSEALYKDLKLKVIYCNVKGETKRRIVDPLGIVEQDSRIYLVCRYSNDSIRHLALHRIQTAVVLNQPSECPRGFDLESYISERTFNYSSDKVNRIHLSFEFTNPILETILKETPFNKTQKLEKFEENLWRVKVDIEDSILLDGWIFTWTEKGGIRSVSKEPVES